ncbi:hypothetical protein HJC23_000811 [Cyclotella cryptica]|uniref:Uncharacterized protein n=1 Tax=Cyclotella cryptica TaxID=29204 RepID=A0ABD3Q585_9STRA|eukprot:CCRYP_008446-RA/>CCRYP_008446-RA protein AED:0.16 eAED:0.16 QI:368/1/1/1/1/1/3/258/411
MDETSSPASDPISPPAANESSKAGGDAVIVNNDAPEYSTRMESDGIGEGVSTGWRAMFVNGHPAVLNYRYLTTLSYLLSAISVCGMIFMRVREEGIYADEYLWMRYQTLLTPAPYTNYIWIPLFGLQGLFLYGSLLPFKNSPLVGYAALSSPQENATERTKSYINCPIIHYPGLCAMSIFMIYSYDRAYMLFATVFALLATVICSKIVIVQLQVLAEADNTPASDEEAGERDMSAVVRGSTSNPLSIAFFQEYISLRLPFELFWGYSVCLVFLYLNTWLHALGLNPKALVVTANMSIFSLLVIAAYILWGLKQGNGRHLYGLVVSMVWYLVGVAVELQAPTQPIYNEFSDGQILRTQFFAGLASTILSSLLMTRIIKSVIKRNVFNLMGACQGKDAAGAVEDDITTGYVHA